MYIHILLVPLSLPPPLYLDGTRFFKAAVMWSNSKLITVKFASFRKQNRMAKVSINSKIYHDQLYP